MLKRNKIILSSLIIGGFSSLAYAKDEVLVCLACPVGTYSDGTKTSCTPCPANTYVNSTATACVSCPSGSWSDAGSTACYKWQLISTLDTGSHSGTLVANRKYKFEMSGGKGGTGGTSVWDAFCWGSIHGAYGGKGCYQSGIFSTGNSSLTYSASVGKQGGKGANYVCDEGGQGATGGTTSITIKNSSGVTVYSLSAKGGEGGLGGQHGKGYGDQERRKPNAKDCSSNGSSGDGYLKIYEAVPI